jgi:hypothetical protein
MAATRRRRHPRHMARPMRVSRRQLALEEALRTAGGLLALAVIYSKLLGLW